MFVRGFHRYLDDLPTTGDASGRAFRDLEWEDKVLKICQEMGIGAQFGGKYFCHDVRVIRVREKKSSVSWATTEFFGRFFFFFSVRRLRTNLSLLQQFSDNVDIRMWCLGAKPFFY